MTFTEKEKAIISDVNACIRRLRELAVSWSECGFIMDVRTSSEGISARLVVNESRTIDLPMSESLVDQAQ